MSLIHPRSADAHGEVEELVGAVVCSVHVEDLDLSTGHPFSQLLYRIRHAIWRDVDPDAGYLVPLCQPCQ